MEKDEVTKQNVCHFINVCLQILKTHQWPQDWKLSVFISIPKKSNANECSTYCTIVIISHAHKLLLKILQARCQQYMNQELPDVQAGFQRGGGTRVQIANICWAMGKIRDSRKASTSASLTMLKPLTVWSTTKWNILKERGRLEHLTCLLRNFYAGQEATVRTRQGTTDWFKIGKGVWQGFILSPCLFNLYVVHIL